MEIIGWWWVSDSRRSFKGYGQQKFWQRPVASTELMNSKLREMNGDKDFPETDAEDLV
jgi:hypothetical protein